MDGIDSLSPVSHTTTLPGSVIILMLNVRIIINRSN
jgi:hypothetical protein